MSEEGLEEKMDMSPKEIKMSTKATSGRKIREEFDDWKKAGTEKTNKIRISEVETSGEKRSWGPKKNHFPSGFYLF